MGAPVYVIPQKDKLKRIKMPDIFQQAIQEAQLPVNVADDPMTLQSIRKIRKNLIFEP